MAQDFADGELAVEQFALKFGTPEKAQGFKDAFEDSKKRNLVAMASSAESTEEKPEEKDE